MEVIETHVPPGCAVRLIDLPYSVDEMVSLDEEGFASIYLNARHSYEKQRKSLRHAIRHLNGNDFYNDKDIRTIEQEADEESIQKKRSIGVMRDMNTLRRIGIIINDWRDDPLLNLPDYDY